MTAVDWPGHRGDREGKGQQACRRSGKGRSKKPERRRVPGYLEAVYHLFSMEKKHGPVILRLRTKNRTDQVQLPSLTPIWRGAEFQEREAFDLSASSSTDIPTCAAFLCGKGSPTIPCARTTCLLPTMRSKRWRVQSHECQPAIDELDLARRCAARRRAASWKSPWARIIRRPTASSAWMSSWTANGRATQAGVRLPAPQSREDR